jgi:Mrp family chromosome partitioning ATPase
VTKRDWQPDSRLKPAERRELRDQLFPFALEGCFVVAVVGVPEAAAEKSAVAAELALALAQSAHPRTLLLEGDLQRPAVHRLMHVEMPLSAGFSQQLHDRVNTGGKAQWTVVSCAKTLHVLAEGVMRAPGLVLSTQFEQSVSELRGFYDFIVIDGPLTSGEVDCRAIDAVVDGVILVCPKANQAALAHALLLFSEKRFTTVVHTR